MTKIITSKMKYCRTTGSNIFGLSKFNKTKKNNTINPPGQHGSRKRKPTEYCKQIRETKKIRLFYGNIKQYYLKKLYDKASNMKGNRIDNLIGMLERRLDMVVFRMKLAKTIFGAKQLVSHGFINVNDKKVDVGSYLVKIGDKISLKEGSIRENHHILSSLSSPDRDTPYFLECNKFNGIFSKIPVMDQSLFPCEMNMQYIIEFLS